MPTSSLPAGPPPSPRLGAGTIIATSMAVALLIAAAWLGGEIVRGVGASNRLGDLVHAAQSADEALLSTLKDAETGQRGYLLTGDLAYLQPYGDARSRLDGDFATLDHARLMDAARADHIQALRRLATEKLKELGETVRLEQAGRHDAAVAMVRTNEGRRLMDAIRGEVSAMHADAQGRLDRARLKTGSILVWGGIAALALLGCLLLGAVVLVQIRAYRVVARAFERLTNFKVALQSSEEERQRADLLLHTIVETAPGLIYAKDRKGRMLVANACCMEMIGKPWAEVQGRTDREFLDDPAQGDAIMANDSRIMESGGPEKIEEVAGSEGRRGRIWLSTKTPLRGTAGQVIGLIGVSVEITERKQVEARLRQMVNELNHRVKNTLATVQSIATQTLSRSDPALRRTLEQRLIALASAHDILTREAWEGANLTEVVTNALSPHGGLETGRFRFDGPSVRLIPRAAVAIAMGLHELAINALKYGALSVEGGQVEILWDILPGERQQFRLLWTERGGPAVTPPATRGFGTRLVERSLAQDVGGIAIIDFEPSGLICEIQAPLTEIAAPAAVVPFPTVGSL